MLRILLVFAVFLCTGCASNSALDSKAVAEMRAKEKVNLLLKAHYEHGEALYKSGQLDDANSEFKAMLKIRPNEPNANYRLGTIAFKQGRFDESADYFSAVVQFDPKNYKAHFNLASIRLMQAENHFKYYAALIDPETDLKKLSQLIADIDRFNSKRSPLDNDISLDQLATSLKK